MTTNLQPPPVPVETRRPYRRPPIIGRSTKVGLTIIAVLLSVRLWDELRTVEGRSFLRDRATSLLLSPDTYIALVVILVNSLIYSLIIKYLYPTGRATLRGLGKAAMLLKGDHICPDGDGGQFGHFFMIFVFPFLVIAAGLAEYQWLKAWLLPR